MTDDFPLSVRDLGPVFKMGVAAKGAPPKRDKECDDGNSGTIDDEVHAVTETSTSPYPGKLGGHHEPG
jgi:hypothetical protein